MNDYFGYFDYDDYFDFFLSDPKTVVPNPKFPDPMCDPNPSPIYLYGYLIKSCIIN